MKVFKSILSLLLIVAILSSGVVRAEGAPLVPTSSKDIQRKLFLSSVCSDGISNGQRIYGKQFDPNDMRTWVLRMQNWIDDMGFPPDTILGGALESANGLNNCLTYSATHEYDDGSMVAVDGFYIFPIGGAVQFINLKDYSISLNIPDRTRADSVTLVDMKKAALVMLTNEFNIHDSDIDISVWSNNSRGVCCFYNSELHASTARYNVKENGSIIKNENEYPAFDGWFNRETGELYSTDVVIDLAKASEEGVHFIEARFAENVEGAKLPTYKIGDINKDREVNTADAVCILKDCVKNEMHIYDDYGRYDVDANGYINTGDAVAILSRCVGI